MLYSENVEVIRRDAIVRYENFVSEVREPSLFTQFLKDCERTTFRQKIRDLLGIRNGQRLLAEEVKSEPTSQRFPVYQERRHSESPMTPFREEYVR